MLRAFKSKIFVADIKLIATYVCDDTYLNPFTVPLMWAYFLQSILCNKENFQTKAKSIFNFHRYMLYYEWNVHASNIVLP